MRKLHLRRAYYFLFSEESNWGKQLSKCNLLRYSTLFTAHECPTRGPFVQVSFFFRLSYLFIDRLAVWAESIARAPMAYFQTHYFAALAKHRIRRLGMYCIHFRAQCIEISSGKSRLRKVNGVEGFSCMRGMFSIGRQAWPVLGGHCIQSPNALDRPLATASAVWALKTWRQS